MSGVLTRFRRCSKKIRNYDDNHAILHACLTPYGDPIELTKFIAEGAYGKVYLARYTTKDGKKIKIAVKIMKNDYEKPELNEIIDNVLYEVEYSYDMASQELGPTIYDAFYVVDRKRQQLTTYILMEAFDYSVSDSYKKDMSVFIYSDIHIQMIDILHSQIFENHMYCTDVKPGNYVVKKVKSEYKVRAIDFGSDWCSLDRFPQEYLNKEIFYLVVLIQLCIVVILELTRSGLNQIITKPFFEDPIYKKYTKNDTKTAELIDVMGKVFGIYEYRTHKHYILPAFKYLDVPANKNDNFILANQVMTFMINYEHFISSSPKSSPPRRSPRRSLDSMV